MSDSAENDPQQSSAPDDIRCKRCDTVNPISQTSCVGCGFALANGSSTDKPSAGAPIPNASSALTQPKERTKRKSLSTNLPAAHTAKEPPHLTLIDKIFPIVALILAGMALWFGLTIRQQQQAIAVITMPPTATVTAVPTAIVTPSQTPIPIPTATTTLTPTPLPTATHTPLPTPTLEPPYEHVISDGEALFNISLRYRVSLESILGVNDGLSADTIVAGQTIFVPRPTATPPLTAVEIVVNGETLVADPTDCVMHEIQSADTYSGIARRFDVPLDALLRMNRLSSESILQPGDRVCIPTMTIALTSIDTATGRLFSAELSPAPQPQLLYPPVDGTIETDVVMLQWIADRDLAPDEWYMVELTNLSDLTTRPFRAFVQQTSFQLPPPLVADAAYRWRVSYVRVSGERADGEFIYAFGSPSSEAFFSVVR